jgi:hypothetical protein
MMIKHISILVNEKDVEKFKVIFNLIQKRHSDTSLHPPKIGRLGGDCLISLRFEEQLYKTAIETLIYNDIKILLPDEETREIIEGIWERRIQFAINSKVKDDYSKLRSHITAKTVEEMVLLGDYEAILDITKNINTDKAVVELAINNLSDTIGRAIEIAVLEAKNDKALIKRSIKKLIQIVSNKKIKSLNKISLLNRAGIEAIELCAEDWDSVKELINISNNNKLQNIVNVKAAIKFYDIVLSNKTKYKNEFDLAVKNLNIRWLIIVLEIVENNLTEEEISKVQNLIDIIKK